ncbi:NlpC/P60 family protein [Streptomyces sp. LX-29]|uniref:C40 family peptidase n=1 Tax=Streptomyces sp. LX-29 TaxID=2900152 RepID=UPI00240DCEB6|nr:C40 family peptidase [Streptomyces sp. LX-29]WFB08928.1 NlpC/P60 family protein [Streptomyces sp. LX-29]
MASHRKPRRRLLPGGSAHAAAALALAGVAGAVTGADTDAQAQPRLSPAQVKAKVDEYHRQAEEATERYNGAKEKADTARARYDELRDEAARKAERLNASRDALGSAATAQYRSGSVAPELQLALSSDPDQYLERASLADRADSRQAAAAAGVARQLRGLRQTRAEAGGRLAELRRSRDALARHKRTIEGKLAAAERLLRQLTAAQRARIAAADAPARPAAAPRPTKQAASARPAAAAPAPSGRAAQAVSYAYGALGKPYVWGATGPSGYDCSGLTQAAWRSAGVALPRTTYTQISAGRRVSRDQLAPGDLVFFYSGVSHVGLYVGDGQMIHAPRPGSAVRLAPVDQMPFTGATRPV